MKENNFPYLEHSERKEGEYWIGNFTQEEFGRIELIKKRQGKLLIYEDGTGENIIPVPPTLFPVFVDENEFIAIDATGGLVLSWLDLKNKYLVPPWPHADCRKNEICFGNWTVEKVRAQIPYKYKRIGKIPCDGRAIPLRPCPRDLFPIFILKTDFERAMVEIDAYMQTLGHVKEKGKANG